MKIAKGAIKVQLEVVYYPFTTRPQACAEECPQFFDNMSGTSCSVYGRLEPQHMPGRTRFKREAACIEAEKTQQKSEIRE